MKAKYVLKKERKGCIVCLKPPTNVERSDSATYMQFDTARDARGFTELQQDFEEYSRRQNLYANHR